MSDPTNTNGNTDTAADAVPKDKPKKGSVLTNLEFDLYKEFQALTKADGTNPTATTRKLITEWITERRSTAPNVDRFDTSA